MPTPPPPKFGIKFTRSDAFSEQVRIETAQLVVLTECCGMFPNFLNGVPVCPKCGRVCEGNAGSYVVIGSNTAFDLWNLVRSNAGYYLSSNRGNT